MVIKMETIGGAHAANAISYVLDKEKARKENKPVFLAANNIELNPLTGKPYSPVEVLMDMQLQQATSKHRAENPFWRIELCPPKEECRDWTMEQWDRFCRDCVKVLDSTDYKTEVVRDKGGYPVIDKRTGKPKVKVSGKHPRAAFSEEELELLRNLKKERADVLLMFNAMIAEFAGLSDAERFRVIINGKSYDWWREHLITALEFFDQMRDSVTSNAD